MADNTAILADFRRHQNDPLRNAIQKASTVDPDQYAQSLQLAQQQSLPVDTVQRNLQEVQRRGMLQGVDVERLRSDNPVLADFLSNPDNAALALDDLQNLQDLENTLTQPNWFVRRAQDLERGVRQLGQSVDVQQAMMASEQVSELERINLQLQEQEFDYREYLAQGGDSSRLPDIQRFTQMTPEQRQAEIERVRGIALKNVAEIAVGTQRIADIPVSTARQRFNRAQGFGEALSAAGQAPFEVITSLGAESLGQFLPALPFLFAGPAVAAGGAGLTSLGVEYGSDILGSMQEAGIDVTNKDAIYEALQNQEIMENWREHAAKRSIPVALIDALSAGTAGQLVRRAATPAGRVGATATEALVVQPGLGGAGEVAGSLVAGDEIEGQAVLAEMLGELGPGTVEIAGATWSARNEAVANRAARDMQTMVRSAGEQQILDTVIERAQGSRLNQRAQDRFQQFLDGIKNYREVYVPQGVIRELLNEGIQLPDYIADQVTVDGLGDVTIPLHRFASEIATQPDVLERIRPHVRLNPESQSQAELQADENQTLRQLVERAQKAQDIKTEADAIYEQVKDQLVATGRQSELTARYSAMLIPAYVTVKAEQYGLTAREVFEMMGLRIEGPTSRAGSGAVVVDQPGTPAFDRWFGDSKVVDAEGKPLVVYHATDNDFSVFDLSRAGENTDSNASSEEWAQTARMGFWFSDRDVSGMTAQGAVMPVYLSIQNPKRYDSLTWLAERAIPFAGSAQELRAELEGDGYDGIVVKDEEFGGTSYIAFRPEQIKSATGNSGAYDPNDPNILKQSAFHGSPFQFDEFSLDAIGTGEGAQMYGWGLYFASQKAVGEYYRGTISYRQVVQKFREEFSDSASIDEVMETLKSGNHSPQMVDLLTALDANDWLGFDYPSQAITAAFRELEAFDVSPELKKAVNNYGNIYQVDIPDDTELLDWDLPLAEQPEPVLQKLIDSGVYDPGLDQRVQELQAEKARVAAVRDPITNQILDERRWHDLSREIEQLRRRQPENITGRQLYYTIRRNATSQREASLALQELGIPGLRYRDQFSRDGTGETTHNYVIWDTDRITIEAVNDQLRQAEQYEKSAINRLNNAPETVNVRGRGPVEIGMFQPALDAAKRYAEVSGIPYTPVEDYAPLSVERAKRIAAEFERMKHDPTDPEVAAAYQAMIDETIAQFRVILDTGLQIEIIRGEDPYADTGPIGALLDVVENNHLWVFSTRDGFGSNEAFDPVDNPLLQETEFVIDGVQLLANDVFRIVHDYFGHVKNGVTFRARGEENAWQSHAAMYSPLARRAMTVETRGQNSWLNYGPYGEQNRTATTEDTIFADQKIGLLPVWVSEEARLSERERRNDPRYTAGLEGAIRPDGRLELVHYSRQPIDRTDPTLAGTGFDRRVSGRRPIQQGTFFGIEATENGYEREGGLGQTRNITSIEPTLVYPANANPEGLWVTGDLEQTIVNLKNAGYSGYWADNPYVGKVAFLFDPMWMEQESQVLFQNQLGFYSALAQYVTDVNLPQWKKPDGDARGQDVWDKLRTAPVKKEELEWTGIEEFLTSAPDARFTRQMVIDYLDGHGINIEEVVATEGGTIDQNIEWDDGMVDDDPDNWEHNVEDALWEYDQGSDTFLLDIGSWMRTWIGDNEEIALEFYADRLTEEQLNALQEDRLARTDEWIKEQIPDANPEIDLRPLARQDFENEAREEAERQYYLDPYYIYYSSDGVPGLTIYGNDEMGYSVRHAGRVVVDDVVYSLNEAQVQAEEWARNEGLLVDEDDPGVARWESYVTDGDYSNYREVKLTLPDLPGEFYEEAHFPDPNIVAWLRVTDRKLTVEQQRIEYPANSITVEYRHQPEMVVKHLAVIRANGEELFTTGIDSEQSVQDVKDKIASAETDRGMKTEPQGQYRSDGKGGLYIDQSPRQNTYFIDEFQSDWHQQGRRKGYATGRVDAGELEQEMLGLIRQRLTLVEDYFYSRGLDPALSSFAVSEYLNPGNTGFRTDQIDRITGIIAEPSFAEMMGQYRTLKEQSDALSEEIDAERYGVPDAPFKGDAWLALGLKRAIVQAVAEGKDAIAWADSNVLKDRWSERYSELYENQYDRKMPKLVRKLTGVEPKHFSFDVPGQPPAAAEQGYWIILITDQLRNQVKTQGFSLFQPTRGSIELLDNERIIRLSKASDLSTFLHETGHLFLEMEKQFAARFGISPDQQAILDFVGAKTLDEITANTPEGIAKHEKFARAFEAYLREGKAPSLRLRDAFAAFARWLKRIYASIRQLNVELTDEIRAVFDRMLATEDEMEQIRANPAYDQFFQSAEQAGMTAEQWEAYQDHVTKARNRAEGNLDAKLLKELHRMRSAEWDEQKRPMVEEETERLSKEPVYQILSDIIREPMDYDAVIAAHGKVPGKMIGKAKKGGVDPQEYAEVYGFDSVQSMLTAIDQAPTLKAAADAAAQERMVEIHGDILNDGTIEQEAREAVHNEAQAALLLEEIRALGRKTRRPDDINRDYLKAEARRLIGTMRYRDIQPNKYYRAELRAAQDAVRSTDPAEQYNLKIQQLANHYLYREAVDTRQQMEKQRRYVRRVQTRNYDTKQVAPEYVQNLKILANMYDLRTDREKQLAARQILEWYEAQINDPNEFVRVELLDPHLVLALEAKRNGQFERLKLPTFDDLNASDLQGLYDMLRHLRHVGGRQSDDARAEFAAEKQALRDSIIENGGKDSPQVGLQPRRLETQRRNLQATMNKLVSLRNLIRRLDNTFDSATDAGLAYEKIYAEIERANSDKIRINREVFEKFNEELSDIYKLKLTRDPASNVTLTKEDGTTWTLSAASRFMLAAYWGTETSREAIREGHGVTDADVMAMMETLTDDQLRMVNRLWRVNESLWPDLSKASVATYGVAPPKLDPTPFSVRGINLTGGHMRLIYDSQELEVRQERDNAGRMTSIMPTKAGSLHARVGSGGRPVLLDVNNISRSLQENIHFIAFAEPGKRIAGLVNSREIQAAIERKHGKGFYKALVTNIDSIVGGRDFRESDATLAHLARLLRQAATMRVLAYSLRNTVQQFSALLPAAHEVGIADLTRTYARFVTPDGYRQIMQFADERSEFMRDRAAYINREASEYLRRMTVSGSAAHAWDVFSRYGFTMQTFVDRHIAYPVWMTRFEQAMEQHGDEARAAVAADVAVSETVGSGNDLHLGQFWGSNNSEFTRTFTMFGSWFNAYYQRMYRSTRGFTGFTKDTVATLITVPLALAIMEALLTVEGPDDDEEWVTWAMTRYAGFLSGTIPLLRDFVGAFSGFTPKTPLASGLETGFRFTSELESYAEGRQTGMKLTSDLLKIGTTLVPVPGTSNFTRTLDYLDSYEQGNEEEFNAYQMIIKGPTR